MGYSLNAILTTMENVEGRLVEIHVNTAALDQALAKFKKLDQVAKKTYKVNIVDNTSGSNSNKGGKSGKSNTADAAEKELKDLEKYKHKLIDARKQLNKAINSAVIDKKGNKPYLDTADLKRQLDEMRTIRNRMSKEIGYILRNGTKHLNDKEESRAITNMIDDAKHARTAYADLSEVARSSQIIPEVDANKMRNFDKLGNRLTTYYNQFEGQIKKNANLVDKHKTLMYRLNNNQFASTRDANNAFAEFRMECRKAGVEVQSFGSILKNTFGSRVRSAMAGQGVYMIQTALREILQSSIQVDTAMTELKKVTDLTETGYNDFLEGAEQRAAKLGATLTEVVNATADYARLGYSVSEATTMSDSALIYTNVGDDVENIDDATSALISTMQGFGIEAENSMSIVDKFNNVSNNYASSAGDIGEIVKRSAASMAAAGNSLDQTIALGVGANEVQQDADTVGTALKTMSMRLRGSKSELEAAGLDVEGMASSTSKLRDEMIALTGVDIMIDSDTFKSSYDILMGIGEVWDQLTDVSQANITEILFGKRQTITCLSM